MITFGLVEAVDSSGVYVSMPGSRGVLRGPYQSVQNSVAAGDRVLMVATDSGEQVVVGTVPGAATGWVTSAMIANGTIVDADINGSAAITQSKIAGMGAWTAYNPSWSGVTMSATTAKYCQIGKTVHFTCVGVLSDAPSGGVTVDAPPVNMANDKAHGPARLEQASSYQGVWFYNSAGSMLVRYLDDAGIWSSLSSTLPAAWSSGHKIALTGTYEAA